MIQICTLKTPKNQACSSDHHVIFAGSQVVRFPWETLLEFGLIIRRYAATWAWVFVNGYLFPPKYWEIVCSWQKRKLEFWKQLWLSLIVAERESRVLEYDGNGEKFILISSYYDSKFEERFLGDPDHLTSWNFDTMPRSLILIFSCLCLSKLFFPNTVFKRSIIYVF